MKKFHIFMLFVTLGFFLMPAITMACEMKSEKSCCNKEMSSKDNSKDCCKKSKDSTKNHDGNCNGKCGHNNCTTSSVPFNLAFYELKIKNNNFDFSENKQNYFHSEASISSGFSSLWLIPKIS
ncbi:hypothetical protein [Flavobacterium cellulosilyticum]|uniref:Lipoprotein n=1 Tax=Flavobacterium cellulosilyticum TaxID=2541731 RepID=A0A4V2YZG9_9FLAO|nr:hypothetical protein [Flavobacterium cellulosilyticum]TDD97077.1 hypothetical protein E0F76_10600 [Flavobacterium cellulosilyticum]